MATTCAWMFGDAASGVFGIQALARYNPARWSGAISFDTCIAQLQKEAAKDGNRPVVVKVPAGIASKENRLESIAAAIDFVKQSDPKTALKEQRIQRAKGNIDYLEARLEEVAKQIEELTARRDGAAASAEAAAADCEWMYGDLNPVARFNPVRWSGKLTFEVAMSQLEAEQDKKDRPIVVKVPAGVTSKENLFPNCASAMAFIKDSNPAVKQLEKEEIETALQNAKATKVDATRQLEEARAELMEAENSS